MTTNYLGFPYFPIVPHIGEDRRACYTVLVLIWLEKCKRLHKRAEDRRPVPMLHLTKK